MALTQALSQAQDAIGSIWNAGSNVLSGASSSSKSHRASLAPQKEIHISALYVHPIKSCRGTSVTKARYTHDGLLYDRTWLIIDRKTNKFCTARELPRMVLIEPRINEETNTLEVSIPLTHKGKGTVTVSTPLEPTEEQLSSMKLVKDITIWIHKVDGYAVSQEADEALSEFFGKDVRLVRKGPSERPSGPDDSRPNPTLNYQDFYPLLVASQASLEHVQRTLVKSVYPSLSDREAPTINVNKAVDVAESQARSQSGSARQPSLDLEAVTSVKVPDSVAHEYWTPEHLESLPIIRFRPNIVLSSTTADDGTPPLLAWEEDGFTHLEVFDSSSPSTPFGAEAKSKGKVGILCLARCARCLVPNIDPHEGIRDPHLPYKALQGYRQVEPQYVPLGKPCFGVLSTIEEDEREKKREDGWLKVGDIVRVTGVVDPDLRVAQKPS